MDETELAEIDAQLAAADEKIRDARTSRIDVIDGVARTAIRIARRLRDVVTTDRAAAVESAARIVEGAGKEIGDDAAAKDRVGRTRHSGRQRNKVVKAPGRKRPAWG